MKPESMQGENERAKLAEGQSNEKAQCCTCAFQAKPAQASACGCLSADNESSEPRPAELSEEALEELMAAAEVLMARAERPEEGADLAARSLAGARQKLSQSLDFDEAAIYKLLRLVLAQCAFLMKAKREPQVDALSDWYLHLLEAHARLPARYQRPFRDALSRLYLYQAKAAKALKEHEKMRLAMRAALDHARDLPFAIVSLLYLYLSLRDEVEIEGKKAKAWLADRCAEALAQLDFAGLASSHFRKSLDDFQYCFRQPQAVQGQWAEIQARKGAEDLAHDTLIQLFRAYFLES